MAVDDDVNYSDLDSEKVIRYVKERTKLFPPDAVLKSRELGRNEEDGDGYVNFIYRVEDESGKSIIVKQAKPFFKKMGKGVPADLKRNSDEADVNLLRLAIVPQYIPQILYVDKANHLFIDEDCKRLDIMRFGLGRGKSYPNFPKMMGEFCAKCNFYTSELYLDDRVWRALGDHFSDPTLYRLFEYILFVREPFFQVYGADNPDPEPGQAEVADAFWNRKEACIELMKMRDIYGKKLQCIVHGDLHTSNTLISPTEMKVIDMEYPHMGPFSADSGYLLGNIVYPYAAWFFHPEWNEDKRAAYREEMLGYIEGMLDEYIAVFSECWKQSVRPIFKRYPEYLASLLLDFLQETAGFMGSQVGSRAGGYTETFDFDVLPDARRRNMARGLALAIGYALLMRRGSVRCPADITAIIRETAEAFMGNPLKGAAVIGNFSGAL